MQSYERGVTHILILHHNHVMDLLSIHAGMVQLAKGGGLTISNNKMPKDYKHA